MSGFVYVGFVFSFAVWGWGCQICALELAGQVFQDLYSQSLLSAHVSPVYNFGLVQRMMERSFGKSMLQGGDTGPVSALISIGKPITETYLVSPSKFLSK